jgi:hypothetical protein
MSSWSFAPLEPLPSQLTGRTLGLCLDDLSGKHSLEAKAAPRSVCRAVLGPQLQQEQTGHDGHRHRALDAVRLFGHLRLPQAHDPFQSAWQVRDQGFEGLPIGKYPGPRESDLAVTQFLDEGQIGPRGIGPIGGDHDLLAPGWAPELM